MWSDQLPTSPTGILSGVDANFNVYIVIGAQ